ncbi:hypothetical protein [Collimonas fungivorans]|uniref:hypothetical protein n=1 Tax=Collimonas fungivorans TaxID=158899 RepID=UPI003FA3CBBD
MHPTIRIFGAFFLAIALASGVLYAIDHSLGIGKSVEQPAKTVAIAPLANNPAPPAASALAPPAASDTAPPPATPLSADNTGAIAKCSIDGKTVYTDKGCPQGSKAKSLQITDNAVIPGVDQATIERTLRQPLPPSLAQAAPPAAVIEPVTSIGTEPGVDCPALGRRLAWLGDMGHRRQPPYIRDRMRRERDELQTRWFWAHC